MQLRGWCLILICLSLYVKPEPVVIQRPHTPHLLTDKISIRNATWQGARDRLGHGQSSASSGLSPIDWLLSDNSVTLSVEVSVAHWPSFANARHYHFDNWNIFIKT